MIIGIDPGYDRIGWAVGEKINNHWQNLAFGCIQTSKLDQISERYLQVQTELAMILKKHSPQEAAIETILFSKNQKTAIRVSEARGLIISVLLTNNIRIFEYNPGTIKQSVTGFGKADKKAVEKMVRIELSLGNQKIIDDAIDALAIMMTHDARKNLNKYLA